MNLRIAAILLLSALIVACTPTQSVEEANQSPTAGLTLPPGFGAEVVADELGRVRHIAVRDNGDLYVKLDKLSDGKGILALRDTNGDGTYDQTEAFGDYKGTGMAIQGNYLYASSDEAVYRYELAVDQLLPANLEGEVLIEGFPEQQTHASKSLAFDTTGHIYVNVGAPSNACQQEARTKGSPGIDPCPQLERHAGVWRFDVNKTGQTQAADGLRYATGIRNIVGMKWNPYADELFVMQHGRDQLSGLWPDLYTDEESALLPSEEMLRVNEGDDFGWPYCYYDQFKDQKMLAPEYGGDSEQTGRCEGIEKPVVAFPGHMAPNDLLFYTASTFPERFQEGAFIAFHGSWNRAPEPQGGYFVAFVPMKDGQVAGEWKPFAEGFPGIEVVKSPRNAAHRPMGLAVTPDGDLLVADSREGRIWRIYYAGDVQ